MSKKSDPVEPARRVVVRWRELAPAEVVRRRAAIAAVIVRAIRRRERERSEADA
jgi:hypothetical protein